MSLLFDEYKILQDKIDKIGGFRVTIKGWAVTATIGGLVAIATGKGFSPNISSCAVDVLLFFFFLFEREQVELGWRFNRRVRDIEIQFDRRRRLLGKAVRFSTPNIARSLFSSKRARHELISKKFTNPSFEKSRMWINRQIRLAIKSEIWFYLILRFAAWLPKLLGVLPSITATPISINNVIQVPPQHVLPATDLQAKKLAKPEITANRLRDRSQSRIQGAK